MRRPDRSTARRRIRLATTGLAIGGAVGVVGVAGGLAFHEQRSPTPVSSVAPRTSEPRTHPTPPSDTQANAQRQHPSAHEHKTHQHASRHDKRASSGVSSGNGQAQAQSSGS